MDCHVVTLSVVVSSHFDAGDHPLEAVHNLFAAEWRTTMISLKRFSSLCVFGSLLFCVGDAGGASFVDAGTPLGATAVVTTGSAGYLLWECCILAPVMWYGHIRDLSPTAEGCMGGRLPNVTRLHWAQQKKRSGVMSVMGR